MGYIAGNNAVSVLAANLGGSVVDTSLVITSSDASLFPAINSGGVGSDYTYLTLQNSANYVEIVKCTRHDTGTSTFTIERGQEGTTIRSWLIGDAVALRLTAGVVSDAFGVFGSIPAATMTFTNKTIDATSNKVLNVGVDEFLSGVTGVNTIAGSADAAITSYVAGQVFSFAAASSNTGAVTLNINGLGAKNLYKSGTLPLEVGDIAAGQVISVIYDGTQFQIASGSGGSGAKAGGVIYENSTTINSSYTLTTNKNGFSVGPISISGGAVLTVPTGARYVVL